MRESSLRVDFEQVAAAAEKKRNELELINRKLEYKLTGAQEMAREERAKREAEAGKADDKTRDLEARLAETLRKAEEQEKCAGEAEKRARDLEKKQFIADSRLLETENELQRLKRDGDRLEAELAKARAMMQEWKARAVDNEVRRANAEARATIEGNKVGDLEAKVGGGKPRRGLQCAMHPLVSNFWPQCEVVRLPYRMGHFGKVFRPTCMRFSVPLASSSISDRWVVLSSPNRPQAETF